MSCYESSCSSCGCCSGGAKGNSDPYREFVPSFTVSRACQLIHMLLRTESCGVTCPDVELCKLLRFECEISCGKFDLGALALMTAARLLESEALNYARAGRFESLTIKFSGDRVAEQLSKLADKWRSQATTCSGPPKFRIARTGRPCQLTSAYHACGCHDYVKQACDVTYVSCDWCCCECNCGTLYGPDSPPDLDDTIVPFVS